MDDPLDVIRRSFARRVRSPRAWAILAFTAPRSLVALALALLPALALIVAALLAPDDFLRAVTDPLHVRETFARFPGAVATAAAIAVSVATLAMERQLRGLASFRSHMDEDERFREHLRRGRAFLPLSVGGTLAVAYQDVAQAAREARAAVGPAERDGHVDDARLGAFLTTVAQSAQDVSERCANARGGSPDRVLITAFDFEEELTSHLARRFLRAPGLDDASRSRLQTLLDRLDDAALARNYAKTLATQWGLSRMSSRLLLTAFFGVFAAAGMVLSYGDGVTERWGMWASLALVAAALVLVALPLATFVSYILRFIFLNAHSLPTRGFVLGPELSDRLEAEADQSVRGRPEPRA